MPTAVAWGLFAGAVAAVGGGMTADKVRIALPEALAAATALAALAGWLPRRAAAARVAVLLATVAGVVVARRLGATALIERGVWLAGLAVHAAVTAPAGLVAAARDWPARLAAAPTGWRAVATAAVGVSAPAAAAYLAGNPFVWTGDTVPVVPTVVRLLGQGTRDLSPFLPPSGYARWDECGPAGTYFVRPVAGRPGVYSSYPAGMEVFAWPAVVAARAAGADLHQDAVHLRVEKAAAGLAAAAAAGLFFLLAARLVPPGPAYLAALWVAFGSVFFSTLGMLLWQQGGTVFWSLVVLLTEFRPGGQTRRGLVMAAVGCSLVLACRPSGVTFLVPFGLWVLARDWRRGLLLPALSAVAFLPWGLMYYTTYGSVFGPSMGFLDAEWRPVAFVGGVLFSPGRGVVVYQPWVAVLALWAVPAVRLGRTTAGPPGWRAFAAAAAAAHLALVGSWGCWWGGTCYGSRLAAEMVVPLGLLALDPLAWLVRRWWGLVAALLLLAAGVAVHVPCVYLDAWLWAPLGGPPLDDHPGRLWDWTRPPFLYPWQSG